MNYKLDYIDYLDFIENDKYKMDEYAIDLLFIPLNVKTFKGHNYMAKVSIFDGTINDFLNREFLLSYEYDNPIARTYKFYIRDNDGDFEYKGNKYKLIDDLLLEGIGTIPNFAFNNYSFNKITIRNCKKIEACAFNNSRVLEFNIDDSIEYIGYNALPINLEMKDGYYNNIILGKINNKEKPIISNNTKIIYALAGKDCKNIDELIIPEGVKMIGSNAFAGCKSIQVLSLPKSLKYIEKNAFLDSNPKYVFYDGSEDEYKKIIINNEDYTYMEWLGRSINLESNPVKEKTKFYVLDNSGNINYNGKKYRKV